jgi:uncharacterized protein (DUF1501 family)
MTALSRREMIALLAASTASCVLPAAFAEGVAGRKFIFVLARGGLDGLSFLVPDDPALEEMRPDLVPARSQRRDVSGGFALHPALDFLHSAFKSGDVSFVHAAASPYRGRSHFDGQDAIETLATAGAGEGWLNRALQASGLNGLALGYALPLAMRGRAPATNWAPPVFQEADEALLNRLAQMYENDPVLAKPLELAMSSTQPEAEMGRARRGNGEVYRQSLKTVGELMAVDGGPGIAMVSLDGWDSHANQSGFLNSRFQGLDSGFRELKDALGPHWERTCIVLCSEFGRTVAQNGTRGTDHGTGGLVMLAGGAVRGARVLGDWPGTHQRALYEGRDLAPANDLVAVLKGVLRDHMGIERSALETQVFPGSGAVFEGLVN